MISRGDSVSKSQVKLWLIIGAAFFIGSLMVILSDTPWSWLSKILEGVGVALITAAVLGITVDRALKLELVRDVFYAAFQYVLPPELKDEILTIISYRFICERHHWLVQIEKLDAPGFVRVTNTLQRTIKNVGASPEQLTPSLHADEWGFRSEKTAILELTAKTNNTTLTGAPEQNEDSTRLSKTETILVKPGASVVVKSRWSEIRQINDVVYLNCNAPTINPEIEVRASPGIKTSLSFGSTSDRVEVVGERSILSGTYLPMHYMVVRWWPEQ